MEKARNHLGSSVGKYKAAEMPLLDGVTDLRTRCLIAVLLANDTFPKELKRHTCFAGVGASAVRDMVGRIRGRHQTPSLDLSFDDLLTEALNSVPKKNKDATHLSQLSSDVVKALVEAMAYEPATVATSGEMLYSVVPPTLPLDRYLEDFTNNDNLLTDTCELGTCPGPTPSHCHTFMIGEGTRHCTVCAQVYCPMCVSTAGVCIPCLGQATDSTDPISKLSEQQLREALSQKIEVPATMPMAELQELYVSIVEGNSMDSLDCSLLEQVRYPIYPPSALRPNNNTLNFVTRFDFHDGARFIRDEKLSTEQRCGIINLLASLVTFCKDNDLPKAAEVLPSMISAFAAGARVDSGERLMKRCIRHALDTKTPPIYDAHASIIEHQGEIGMVIHDSIAPSFKDGMYSVTAAFTSSCFLANKCDCKAGADLAVLQQHCTESSNAGGKHLCVHPLPVLYKLTILLMDGLAEHALVEFASCFTQHHESALSQEEAAQLKESILTLMDASSFVSDSASSKTSHELLEAFTVGTERGKSKLPAPPDPSLAWSAS